MNLHAYVAPYIGIVNPNIPATFEASTGPVQAADFSQQPSFAAPITVTAQVQELSSQDLQHFEGLNLQGSAVGIYLYGSANGVVRVSQKGGDRITIASGPSAGVYLVVKQLEQWPDWVKVAAQLQNIPVA